MLFAEFDWNRVLIGGAIGAGVGVIVYLIRLAIGSGKDDREGR